MSSREKLIQKILAGMPISYQEAEALLFALGYEVNIKGSHHSFRKPGRKRITIKKRTQLFPYQIKALQEALYEHGYEEIKQTYH